MEKYNTTSEAKQSGLGSEPPNILTRGRLMLPLDRSGDLRAAIRSEYEAEEAAAAALLEEAV